MPNSNRGDCGFQSEEFGETYDRPSKSQRKREMTALQKLGEQLVDASAERVDRIGIPEDLHNAITECRRIKNHAKAEDASYNTSASSCARSMKKTSPESTTPSKAGRDCHVQTRFSCTHWKTSARNSCRRKRRSRNSCNATRMQMSSSCERSSAMRERKFPEANRRRLDREIYRLLRQIMTESSHAKVVLYDTHNEENHEQ